jgi:hypothetical protein
MTYSSTGGVKKVREIGQILETILASFDSQKNQTARLSSQSSRQMKPKGGAPNMISPFMDASTDSTVVNMFLPSTSRNQIQ